MAFHISNRSQGFVTTDIFRALKGTVIEPKGGYVGGMAKCHLILIGNRSIDPILDRIRKRRPGVSFVWKLGILHLTDGPFLTWQGCANTELHELHDWRPFVESEVKETRMNKKRFNDDNWLKNLISRTSESLGECDPGSASAA
jgi:hypothetical protein